MLDLLILADDFTGALDTGVQFSKLSIPTLVTSNTKIKLNKIDKSIKVLVINTETRHLSPSDAYSKILEILNSFDRNKFKTFYKKIDSALRGNILSEIRAVMDYFDKSNASIIASYPQMNRIVKNGKLYINGKLVSESVFSKDPFEPVTESKISNILKSLNLCIENIYDIQKFKIDDFRKIYIFDSTNNEEMSNIYKKLKLNNQLEVIIGCAGFAEVIALNIANSIISLKSKYNYPLAIVSGSLNQITINQIKEFEKKYNNVISLDENQLLDFNYWNKKNDKNLKNKLLNKYLNNDKTVFETYKVYQNSPKSIINSMQDISRGLGELTKFLIEKIGYQNFMFIGGDTFLGVMEVLGIKDIIPICEIEHGIVLSKLYFNDKEINVISKSGGFGEVNLFEKI